MDKTYWREFYSRHKIGVEPSLFAKLVYKNYLLESIKCDTDKYAESSTPSLLELGCGNGRDSLYFAHKGVDTTAIDQVQEEIEYLNDYVVSLLEKDKSSQKDTNTIDTNANAESLSQSKAQKTNARNNPHFLCGDFTQLDSFSFQQQFDCIYSRFTLHSISKAQQDKTLADCLKYCKEGGILAIEVRGEKNSLCGKGKAVEGEPNAFIYDNHYRRFLNFTQTLQEIESLRFTPNNVAQRAISQNQNNMNNTHTTAGGGGVYIMLLLIVLRFFTLERTKALHHLMVKMTTLFALSQERSIARLKAFFESSLKIDFTPIFESSPRFTSNTKYVYPNAFALNNPSRVAQ